MSDRSASNRRFLVGLRFLPTLLKPPAWMASII
jgi:hypothetical protein